MAVQKAYGTRTWQSRRYQSPPIPRRRVVWA